MDEPSKRSVVLHPRTAAARRFDRRRGHGSHVRGHTVDTEQVLELVRRQARASFLHLAIVILPLLAFMAALVFIKPLRTARIGSLPPVPWLVLGPIVLFSIAGLAIHHERQANRIEDEWSAAHRERRQ